MEYFDFEEASNAIKNVPDDDVASDFASDCQEVDETEAVENYESLFFDKNFQLHAGGVGLAAEAGEDENEDLQNQDSIPGPAESTVAGERNAGSQYPMFLSPQPCDFCRQMGFDCFIIQRGVLNNGCTCCVSLYRECSFTHTKAPGKYLHTLHPVGEDDVTSTGGPTGIRTLKSVGSSKFDYLESRGRKSGARFSRDAVRILKNWLADHNQNPYPNEEEKDALKQRTGLKRNQIANWLANARRRGKVLPPTRSTSPTPGAVDIPGSSNTPSASSTVSTSSSSTVEYALMTPLERWKHSPPEHEAAATSDIIRAMANASLPPPSPSNVQNQSQQQSQAAPPTVSGHGRSMSRKTGSSNDSNSLFRAPSVSSYETENKSATSDYSFASAFSHRSSQHSFKSTDRKDRRRRRKHMPPVPAFDRPVRGARIFQCTFCTDTFPAKYDWQRHEKSVHLALEKWTCAPQGGVITTSDGQKICSFCRSSNPTEDHLETHNYQACQEKTMQERTFYRKDHLNQHLRLMHDVKYDSSMDQWRSTTNEIKSRCGLCDANFTTWKDRVDHIAQHFKNGADMSQWKGDWGLEPYVQRLVENSIPPYLIASERESLNPRRASGNNNSSSQKTPASIATSSVKLLDPTDETSFARLENELKAYIACQLLDGNFPSDKQIQDQGRIIVYGSAEVWYKTCADNAIWLSMLKRDCGMEDLPGLENITLEELGLQPPFAGCLQRPPPETNHLAAKNVRHSWFSNASLGSAALSITGMQSPALISSGGFHSPAVASIPGSLAGSYSGSIAMSSAAPSSGMPGLSSGWSSNFSVGEQSTSDWTGLPAFENNPAHTSFELEVLQQLNDPESHSMDIDSSLFGLGGLNIPDGTPSQFKPDDFSKNVNVPQFDHGMTTTQTAPVPISTTNSNNGGMLSQFDSFFSSQPGFQ